MTGDESSVSGTAITSPVIAAIAGRLSRITAHIGKVEGGRVLPYP
jgi:hypothetical protein